MTVGIIPNISIDRTFLTADILKEKLLKAGISAYIYDSIEDIHAQETEMIISIGGDGTYLHTMRYAANQQSPVPVLGMNMGHLGFLTQFDETGIDEAVYMIKNSEFTIEERFLENIEVYRDGKKIFSDFAFNDTVIYRDNAKMLETEVHVDESYAASYLGDGLIIATPTGSTAYSLSAGGPIIEPESKVLLLTPICPHSVSSRPMVVSENRTIRICIKERNHPSAMLTADGEEGFKIEVGDEITVKKSDMKAKVVRLYQTDFYKVLREKLL